MIYQLTSFGLGLAVSGTLGLQACLAGEASPPNLIEMQEFQFKSIYEPSGALRLRDGNILIIEDESSNPLSLWNPDSSVSTKIRIKGSGFGIGSLEDVEGIASDGRGLIYLATSHSRTLKGKQRRSRRKIVRFDIKNGELTAGKTIGNLRKTILKKHAMISVGASKPATDLNIEALSYHRADRTLMIGLRSPVISDYAIIVVLKNPDEVFDQGANPDLANNFISLDLDKGGIRAIAYDEFLGGYLILSRREDKKDKSFKLWLWDGVATHKPTRIKFSEKIDLDHAEGITPIKHRGQDGLLVVFDDGNRQRRKGGHYVFLHYDALDFRETDNAVLP